MLVIHCLGTSARTLQLLWAKSMRGVNDLQSTLVVNGFNLHNYFS